MAAEFDRKFEAIMTVIRETAAGQVGVRPNSAVGSFSPDNSGPRRFSHDSGKSVASNAALANVTANISKSGGGKATNFSRARSSSPRGDR